MAISCLWHKLSPLIPVEQDEKSKGYYAPAFMVQKNQILKLKDLPAPPSYRAGWPWTKLLQFKEKNTLQDWALPKITIVTPNYNYGQYLEETIRSVLLQGYPNLEYFIFDGGSTDNSVEIIKKYEKWITYWVSEKDEGQASAINKGLKMASGQWFNWLNSDDILMPNALMTLARISHLVSDASWISGARIEMNKYCEYCDICVPWRTDPIGLAIGAIYLPQDATFVKTDFVRENNIHLDEQYNIVFDTIFHHQLLTLEKPLLTSVVFSGIRRHEVNKTTLRDQMSKERREGVFPFIIKSSCFNRIVYRLLFTRFHVLVRILLLLAIAFRIIPYSRDWKAVIFDRSTTSLKLVKASDAIFGIDS